MQLKKFNVMVRSFDPQKGVASGEEFLLPVDSPDEEHAISGCDVQCRCVHHQDKSRLPATDCVLLRRYRGKSLITMPARTERRCSDTEELDEDIGDTAPAAWQDLYASHYSAVGAMRAGVELYRAFDWDAEDNRAALKKNRRLTMHVLALGDTSSFFLPIAKAMLAEVAKKVSVVGIPECGHWIAEENPKALVDELLKLCSS